jgi:hypothetical protein
MSAITYTGTYTMSLTNHSAVSGVGDVTRTLRFKNYKLEWNNNSTWTSVPVSNYQP